jgi:hypothetical protein
MRIHAPPGLLQWIVSVPKPYNASSRLKLEQILLVTTRALKLIDI